MPDWNLWLKRIKWVLTCLVFFALPFILTAYGLGIIYEARETDSLREVYRELDSLLLRFRKREAVDTYISEQLFNLRKKSFEQEEPFKALGRGIAGLKKRFPGILHFTVVDKNGDLVPELTDGSPPRTVVKRMTQAILNPQTTRREVEKMWSFYRRFIGNEAIPSRLKRLNQLEISLQTVSINESKRYFMFSIGKTGGFFLHMDHTRDHELLALKDQISRFRQFRPKSGVETGIVELGEDRVDDPSISLALGEFERTSQPHLSYGGKLFSIMMVSHSARLWAARPKSASLDLNLSRVRLCIIGTILFAILTITSHSVIVREHRFKFSIRWRLIVLFAFASGLPVVLILFSGWDYLNQKYSAMTRQLHDDTERALMAFDSRFPQMRSLVERVINNKMEQCRFETPQDRQQTCTVFTKIARDHKLSELVIFDSKGKTVWDSKRELSETHRAGHKIMGGVGAKILGHINDQPTDVKLDSTVLLLETMGGTSEGILRLARSVGTIIPMDLAETQSWTILKPLYARDGTASHLAMGSWQKHELEKYYIEKYLVGSRRLTGGISILADDLKNNRFYPKEYPNLSRLDDFKHELELRQSTTIGKVQMGDHNLLVTGIKAKELEFFRLIGVVSDKPVRIKIGNLRMKMWLFVAVCAITSVFLGFVLSERFLAPISELAKGVRAIENRRFRFKIDYTANDELGELARAFNNVMEGLSDLEVARIVQESLFPTSKIESGEFAVAGRSFAATALGGDYFDLYKLESGKILIVIGDVSGHGVPAALVMAMAKALIERETEIFNDSKGILTVLHAVFFRTLKRKRIMTCFIGILDPADGSFEYANAGHNFPFLCRNSGEVKFLEQGKSYPLGSVKKNTFEPGLLELEPGDRLVMYTDGLVETTTATGAIGYERLRKNLDSLLDDDPEKACEKIFNWQTSLSTAQDQEDDITVVILTRKTASKTSQTTIIS